MLEIFQIKKNVSFGFDFDENDICLRQWYLQISGNIQIYEYIKQDFLSRGLNTIVLVVLMHKISSISPHAIGSEERKNTNCVYQVELIMKNCKYKIQLKVHQGFQLNMQKQTPLENIIGFLKLGDGFGRL